MNKKKLPKAFVVTADAMRAPGSERTDTAQSKPMNEPAPAPSRDNVVEMSPKTSPSTETAKAAPASSAAKSPATMDAAQRKRRMQARTIIERHANMSAVGGALPIPLANVASITAVQVRMVRQLSLLYGVPFERTRARAIVIGLMGGVMPTGVATIAVSTLTYFVPGYGAIGLAVSSVTAAAYARSIGQLFIEHFESGSTLVDFPMVVLR
jgi:uncharacterized protein (DUF697 family)